MTSSNESSDDDDISNVLSNTNRLRRKYIKAPQEPPLSLLLNQAQPVPEQSQPAPLSSSTLKGVLLRPKQQQQQKQSARVFQTSSKDVGKRLKRFTADTTENRWHQQVPESNIHRSSMAIVPSLNTNAYGIPVNNNSSHNLSTIKLSQQKDDFHSDIQPRSKVNLEVVLYRMNIMFFSHEI